MLLSIPTLEALQHTANAAMGYTSADVFNVTFTGMSTPPLDTDLARINQLKAKLEQIEDDFLTDQAADLESTKRLYAEIAQLQKNIALSEEEIERERETAGENYRDNKDELWDLGIVASSEVPGFDVKSSIDVDYDPETYYGPTE